MTPSSIGPLSYFSGVSWSFARPTASLFPILLATISDRIVLVIEVGVYEISIISVFIHFLLNSKMDMNTNEKVIAIDSHTSLHCTGGLRASIISLESEGIITDVHQARALSLCVCHA